MIGFIQSFRDNLRSGDIVSPMLIKELRQGMKTRTFVSVFLIVQSLLAFAVIYNLIALRSSELNYDATASIIFWGTIGFPLLIIIPFMGMNSVSSEIKGATLDLLYLTRLSAWKIVFGKWFSLFSQALLLLAAILPYVVIRYFLGGVNVVQELTAIGWIVVISGILTAVSVGLSGFGGLASKVMIVIGVILIFLAGISWLEYMMRYSGGMSGSSSLPVFPPWAEVILKFSLFGSALVLGAYLFLEFGAAAIAPPAENHALRKRISGILLLCCAAGFSFIRDENMTILCLVGALVVVTFALLEPEVLVPTLYRARWLPFGLRQIAPIFYPGWCNALLYSLIMLAGGIAILQEWLDTDEKWLMLLSLFASVVWGAAVARLQPGQTKRPVLLFIGLQIAGSLLALMVSLFQSIGFSGLGIWLFPFPISVFCMAAADTTPNATEPLLIFATVVVTILCYVFLRLSARPILKRIRELEKLSVPPKTTP